MSVLLIACLCTTLIESTEITRTSDETSPTPSKRKLLGAEFATGILRGCFDEYYIPRQTTGRTTTDYFPSDQNMNEFVMLGASLCLRSIYSRDQELYRSEGALAHGAGQFIAQVCITCARNGGVSQDELFRLVMGNINGHLLVGFVNTLNRTINS